MLTSQDAVSLLQVLHLDQGCRQYSCSVFKQTPDRSEPKPQKSWFSEQFVSYQVSSEELWCERYWNGAGVTVHILEQCLHSNETRYLAPCSSSCWTQMQKSYPYKGLITRHKHSHLSLCFQRGEVLSCCF